MTPKFLLFPNFLLFPDFLPFTLLALSLSFALPAHAARERLRFDDGWRFHLGDPAGAASGKSVTGWQWRAAHEGETAAPTDANGWQAAKPGQDLFGGRQGFAWVRATLPDAPGPTRALHFENVDDNAVIYLNGVKVGTHEGWADAFDVNLDAGWKNGGPNALTVRIENTAGAGNFGEAMVQSATAAQLTPSPAKIAFNDSTWQSVHLPHDFVVAGAFDPNADGSHGFLPKGVGWYRKTFSLPKSDVGKSLWLDFDGVYRNSTVWLNGKELGKWPSGYMGFRYEISNAANFGGQNTLVVRADARQNEGWWYEGGGIYRHVWLTKTNPTHIVPDSVFVKTRVDGDPASPTAATLEITTEARVQFSSNVSPTSVMVEVRDPRGRIVGHASALPVRNKPANPNSVIVSDFPIIGVPLVKYAQTLTVSKPALWSLEKPQLYRLTTRLVRDGKIVDEVKTSFGVRTIRFDAKTGFFLNGKPVKIQGTCNHQDFAGLGVALPDSVQYWRIAKLKEMGSNAYRTSHNAPTPELLDACDKLGMLVMDETRHLGDATTPKTPRGASFDSLAELKAMVKRDRNHPSVIMWSMANEEPLQGSEEGAKIFAAMKAATLALDPTRPTTSAMNGGWGSGFTTVQDLQGVNYSPNVYDGFHRDFPRMPFFGSETSSAVTTRGIYSTTEFTLDGVKYWGEREKGYVSAYDVNAPGWAQIAQTAWKPIAEQPWNAGGFVWTGFDYRGEPTPYGWPCVNSHFGILDMCGFPKDNFYFYQSVWGGRPMVHVLPHWNWPGQNGQEKIVWAYSNAARVELFLNAKSLGAQDVPRNGHAEWRVHYAPGTLEARAVTGSKVVVTDKVETTGPPASLRLEPDRTKIAADGEDVAIVAVSVLDAKGRVVPVADNLVTFSLSGPGQIAGVGNGDPSSHEPDKASQRHAFNGHCLVIVQSGDKAGTMKLVAASPGLPSATLTVQAR